MCVCLSEFVCLFVCLSGAGYFSFSRFDPRKRQYPSIFGRGLKFLTPPDAIGFTFKARK